MSKERNIGIKVKTPEKECNDKNCPFHGSLKCRGRVFIGTIIGTKMHKTATVEWTRRYYLLKYERYEKRRTRIKVHNPSCISARDGDVVRVMECRPLSKTKNFVVIEKLGKERGFKERVEAIEESKFKEVKKEEEENEGPKS